MEKSPTYLYHAAVAAGCPFARRNFSNAATLNKSQFDWKLFNSAQSPFPVFLPLYNLVFGNMFVQVNRWC